MTKETKENCKTDPIASLGQEAGSMINKMRKDQLINALVGITLLKRVRDEDIQQLEKKIISMEVHHKQEHINKDHEHSFNLKKLGRQNDELRTNLNQALNMLKASTIHWDK